MDSNKISRLQLSCLNIGVDIHQDILQNLLNYIDILSRWQNAYNFTRLQDNSELKIIIESLSIQQFLSGSTFVDVGTGAGIPGIILAIANPNLSFKLLDSNKKKTNFLRQVGYELSLDNIEVCHTRVEKYQPQIKIDGILSRAFSDLRKFILQCQHLCHDDCEFLALKGKNYHNEINNIPEGFVLYDTHKLMVPGLDRERYLLQIRRSQKIGNSN